VSNDSLPPPPPPAESVPVASLVRRGGSAAQLAIGAVGGLGSFKGTKTALNEKIVSSWALHRAWVEWRVVYIASVFSKLVLMSRAFATLKSRYSQRHRGLMTTSPCLGLAARARVYRRLKASAVVLSDKSPSPMAIRTATPSKRSPVGFYSTPGVGSKKDSRSGSSSSSRHRPGQVSAGNTYDEADSIYSPVPPPPPPIPPNSADNDTDADSEPDIHIIRGTGSMSSVNGKGKGVGMGSVSGMGKVLSAQHYDESSPSARTELPQSVLYRAPVAAVREIDVRAWLQTPDSPPDNADDLDGIQVVLPPVTITPRRVRGRRHHRLHLLSHRLRQWLARTDAKRKQIDLCDHGQYFHEMQGASQVLRHLERVVKARGQLRVFTFRLLGACFEKWMQRYSHNFSYKQYEERISARHRTNLLLNGFLRLKTLLLDEKASTCLSIRRHQDRAAEHNFNRRACRSALRHWITYVIRRKDVYYASSRVVSDVVLAANHLRQSLLRRGMEQFRRFASINRRRLRHVSQRAGHNIVLFKMYTAIKQLRNHTYKCRHNHLSNKLGHRLIQAAKIRSKALLLQYWHYCTLTKKRSKTNCIKGSRYYIRR
jgi:hypothetical protein